MIRILSLTLFAGIWLVAATPALASIASPASGFPFGINLGTTANVKLKNASGCTFDFTAVSTDPMIATVAPASGTNTKRVTIGITGVSVGMTTVTITSSGGTCPPAVHTYPVTVSADYQRIQKDFDKYVNSSIKDYRVNTKLAFTNYKFELKDLGIDYRDSVLNNVQLYQGFHAAGTQLRVDYWNAGIGAYTDVVGFGSNQLLSAAAQFGDAPDEMFAFGWGSFDDFQDFVCGDFAKFHTTYRKESHKAIKTFMKYGAPGIGQFVAVPPIVSGGPLYPAQLGAIPLPFTLTGPLTITSLPATNMTGDDGRIAVSGTGQTAESGNLDVTLSFYQNGMMMQSWMLSPTINNGEWDTEFTGLSEGTYLLDVGYNLDIGRVQVPIQLQWDF